jgi:hypothetical protein
MKAKLIKKSDGWYNLYDKEIGIGSTHAELQGHKLSKQNCNEIFGIYSPSELSKVLTEDQRGAFEFGYCLARQHLSLQQPKEIEVEIEMECLDPNCDGIDKKGVCIPGNKPKLDSQGCLILKHVV